MGSSSSTAGALIADIGAARRRSALLGIDPAGSEIREAGEPTPAADALGHMSKPVLDRLISRLDDARVGVVLADRAGAIMLRDAATRRLLGSMERGGLAVGCSLAEDDCGTNGVGTSLETKLPTLVSGSDHFLERFQAFTCANAPIVHPVTRRVEGTIGVLCPVSDTNPLMLPTALGLAAELGRILLDRATPVERFLAEQFVEQRGPVRQSVATIGDGMWIAAPAAQRLLGGVDPAELWDRVRSAVRAAGHGSVEVELDQPTQPTLRLRCRPLYLAGEFSGASIEVLPERPKPVSRPAGSGRHQDRLGDLIGSSDAWQAMVREARRVAQRDVPVLIAGERGSGRLSVASAIAEAAGAGSVKVFDSATVLIEGAREWLLGVIAAIADDATTVVLRRIDELDDHVAAALAAEIADRPVGVRIVATMGDNAVSRRGVSERGDDRPGGAALLDQLDVVRIVVPPLRERRTDIDALARHLSARFGPRRLDSSALALLYRYQWPGNVTELCQVLRRAHALASSDLIGASQLPQHLRHVHHRRPLHGLAQHEATAIVEALRIASSRREAAEMLGISRATLYRRIESYGLDPGQS